MFTSIGTASVGYAQQTSSVQWPLTDPDAGGTGLSAVVSGPLKGPDEVLNNTEINHYTGPNSSQRVRIEGNEWPANQTTQIDDVYIEFQVKPQLGSAFNVNNLSLKIAGVSISSMKANIYYDTDTDFSDATQVNYTTNDDSGNNYLPRDTLLTVSATPSTHVGQDSTFYVRIYPWVDNDPDVRTGKYMAIQDVKVEGETEDIPLEASTNWPLNDDENPVISGALTAQAQSYSDAMKLYNFKEVSTAGGDTTLASTIQTASKDWTASDQPVDSLYIQYEVAPKYGATFYPDHFAISMGAWFTNNLRATVFYSKDSTFTERHELIADTALVSGDNNEGGARFMEASMEDTVETGEKLYVRVYPHNTETEGWAKLVVVDSVLVSGTTVGATADPPEVATYNVGSVTTTTAEGGGNISNDGGAEVTSRGVVWSTEMNPTLDDSKTMDGSGTGSFTSQITGLEAGTIYHVRAYATNDAGTSYGRDVPFQTLDSLSVPQVTTGEIGKIMVETAKVNGTVEEWGGDTVRTRGFVWNTTGDPTLDDNKIVAGSGLGDFNGTLYPLEADTKYYVRAFATNEQGTGYGIARFFTTQKPAPDVEKVVAKDGSGDYTSVQEAFDDVPDFYTGNYVIKVKNGVYKEKLFLGENKTNVHLVGQSRDSTILTYDDYAAIAGGTSESYSASIDGDDFIAKNITFRNTVVNDKSTSGQQAVALETNGDRQAYYNVRVMGYQDTYYARGAHGTDRIYFKNSYIEGSVDFIFGRDIVVFDSTEIHINRNGGTLTAASTEPDSKFGFVFRDSKITADSVGFDGDVIDEIYLGRPWHGEPRTVFLNTYETGALAPEGWLSWNVEPGRYAEYNCSGPGCTNLGSRADFSEQLTDEQAAEYTLENIFAKESNPRFGRDWMPQNTDVVVSVEKPTEDVPEKFELKQNYPNPFNPTTNIRYALAKSGHVQITVYDMLGRKVQTLVNATKKAGRYTATFEAGDLSSGIYFYRIKTNGFAKVKKMMLLK